MGDNVSHEAVLRLLIKAGGPAGLRALGRARIDRELAKHAPRIHARLADEIWDGLAAQTVTVTGTTAAAKVLPGSQARSCSSGTSAGRSPRTSRGSSMPTLFPKS